MAEHYSSVKYGSSYWSSDFGGKVYPRIDTNGHKFPLWKPPLEIRTPHPKDTISFKPVYTSSPAGKSKVTIEHLFLHPSDQRQVNLEIVTGTGYTVYDKEQGIAYVQVERGNDNITLHGMELMIEFDGTTYKTTLKAPNPNGDKSYFFDMNSMKDAGKLPGMVSVAPIFILDARQILGQITSKVTMPIMSIAKNKALIIAELEGKNEEVINLTIENQTIDLINTKTA